MLGFTRSAGGLRMPPQKGLIHLPFFIRNFRVWKISIDEPGVEPAISRHVQHLPGNSRMGRLNIDTIYFFIKMPVWNAHPLFGLDESPWAVTFGL